MNKSILFIVLLVICTLATAASPRRKNGPREGRLDKHRGKMGSDDPPNDPKMCWPTMKAARDCCAAPELFDKSQMSTCKNSIKNEEKTHGAVVKSDAQGRKKRDAGGDLPPKGSGERKGDGEKGRGFGKMFMKARIMDCFFTEKNLYTATGGIDAAKVMDLVKANPNFTAEWLAVATTAVPECAAGAETFDSSKMPTPPPRPGKSVATTNFKAMSLVGCVKRYFTINCVATSTKTSDKCKELVGKLKQCDPFYMPPRKGPPPSSDLKGTVG